MSKREALRCPYCHDLLSCSYYGSGRVVQCESCGLRGPASPSEDDDSELPLTLFVMNCTALAAEVRLGEQSREIESVGGPA